MKNTTIATLIVTVACFGSPAEAQTTVWAQNLVGFNAAAGSPPVSVSFDTIGAGTDIGGTTIAGATFLAGAAPLIVVKGADTFTPGAGFTGVSDPGIHKLLPTSGLNVLSPGGLLLGPGPNPGVENDDLTLLFSQPVSAFGFDHLSQSADGFSYTSVTVYDVGNNVLFSGTIPISSLAGGAGGADFWGITSSSANIKKIVFDEGDGDSNYADCNIGFDTLRFVPTDSSPAVPEPGALVLILAATLPLIGRHRSTRRQSRGL